LRGSPWFKAYRGPRSFYQRRRPTTRASSLHISEATVKRHLANVYEKIGVHSRTEATQKALAEGGSPKRTSPWRLT